MAKLTDSTMKKLTSKHTLIKDATKNLKQRVAEFNADNPEKPITYHQLRRLYRDQRIRFKKVLTKLNQRRSNTETKSAKDQRILRTLKHEVEQALLHSDEIIMIDEAVFSQTSCKPLAWSGVRDNIVADTWWRSESAIAACMAVSEKRGVINYHTAVKSFNAQSFSNFLNDLASDVNCNKAIIILDNASIHRSKTA